MSKSTASRLVAMAAAMSNSTSYFPAQKSLFWKARAKPSESGRLRGEYFPRFELSFPLSFPFSLPLLLQLISQATSRIYPVSRSARTVPMLIKVSAITPKPTQRSIPSAPR